jgi:hypothetical protein
MARQADGIRPQPETDTALFAHLAYKLEGVATGGLNDWAQQLGIRVRADALRNAPRHAARLEGVADPRSVVRPWLLPEWRALNFFMAAVRVELPRAEPAAAKALEIIAGVIEVFAWERGALAIVVYERRSDRDALRARLEDFAEIESWQEIESHRPQAVIDTFRALALQAAAKERLLEEP